MTQGFRGGSPRTGAAPLSLWPEAGETFNLAGRLDGLTDLTVIAEHNLSGAWLTSTEVDLACGLRFLVNGAARTRVESYRAYLLSPCCSATFEFFSDSRGLRCFHCDAAYPYEAVPQAPSFEISEFHRESLKREKIERWLTPHLNLFELTLAVDPILTTLSQVAAESRRRLEEAWCPWPRPLVAP